MFSVTNELCAFCVFKLQLSYANPLNIPVKGQWSLVILFLQTESGSPVFSDFEQRFFDLKSFSQNQRLVLSWSPVLLEFFPIFHW